MNYPIYILFRSKTENEPMFIVRIENEFENTGMQLPSDMTFYRDRGAFKYGHQEISQAEAETYDVIGVAPIVSIVQFVKHFVKVFNREYEDAN